MRRCKKQGVSRWDKTKKKFSPPQAWKAFKVCAKQITDLTFPSILSEWLLCIVTAWYMCIELWEVLIGGCALLCFHQMFDRNCDGYISGGELQATMQEMGIELSGEDLTNMMRETDINQDGKIDYKGDTSSQLTFRLDLTKSQTLARGGT